MEAAYFSAMEVVCCAKCMLGGGIWEGQTGVDILSWLEVLHVCACCTCQPGAAGWVFTFGSVQGYPQVLQAAH